jgi:hypothetical protein
MLRQETSGASKRFAANKAQDTSGYRACGRTSVDRFALHRGRTDLRPRAGKREAIPLYSRAASTERRCPRRSSSLKHPFLSPRLLRKWKKELAAADCRAHVTFTRGLLSRCQHTLRLSFPYAETSPILVRGPARGRQYQFSGLKPVQAVDVRDVGPLFAPVFLLELIKELRA